MNESPSSPSLWYWLAVVLLILGGVGALWSPSGASAIRAVSAGTDSGSSRVPTADDLTRDFRQFRTEVAQLSSEEQAKVWQSLTVRTSSVSEQTLYTFFA